MKIRIDQLLVMRGYFDSREKAKRALMAGEIFCGTQRIEKAGSMVDENIELIVKSQKPKYVSRGGLKLEKAIIEFAIDLKDKICMDIGASTGGFSDCMLQNGAKKVYSVDVGYGQLDYGLRNDSRIVVMERTNARYIDEVEIPDKIDFASFDVSFISVKTIMPAVITKLNDNSQLVCLIKPQFEAGREKVGKKGVVRDKETHKEVLNSVILSLIDMGLTFKNLSFSPITGPNGNIEFLANFVYKKTNENNLTEVEKNEKIRDIACSIVEKSHRTLF